MDMDLFEHLLKGVEVTSELVRLLFKTNSHTVEDSHQYRQCLYMFGLETTTSGSLCFYPKLKPRWTEISKKHVSWSCNVAVD